jgi:hypothetical protein
VAVVAALHCRQVLDIPEPHVDLDEILQYQSAFRESVPQVLKPARELFRRTAAEATVQPEENEAPRRPRLPSSYGVSGFSLSLTSPAPLRLLLRLRGVRPRGASGIAIGTVQGPVTSRSRRTSLAFAPPSITILSGIVSSVCRGCSHSRPEDPYRCSPMGLWQKR